MEPNRGLSGTVVGWALGIAFAGAFFWIMLAHSGKPNTNTALIVQASLDWVLAFLGTAVVSVGLLGFVVELIAHRRTQHLLHCALLVSIGLAVYTRNQWSIVGVALVAGVLVLHEFLAQRSHTDQPAGNDNKVQQDTRANIAAAALADKDAPPNSPS